MIKYLCEGCKFLGIHNFCEYKNNLLYCKLCSNSDNVSIKNTFSTFSKSGYCCKYCKRFIPNPLNNQDYIICPYDCIFSGRFRNLKKQNCESLELDDNSTSLNKSKEYIAVENAIESRISYYNYVSTIEFTKHHKLSVLESFLFYLKNNQDDLINYLFFNKRGINIQNKIYKKYISILELKLPISFKKNKKTYIINSLFDSNIEIFSGLSNFETIVKNGIIDNKTKEIYVGGRSGFYTKPYFIGKLVDVVDIQTKSSILNAVKDYNFNNIFINEKFNDRKVNVIHLRTMPHYQGGGMTYVNRMKNEIVGILKEDNV